jgi:hypothetical protein
MKFGDMFVIPQIDGVLWALVTSGEREVGYGELGRG